MKTRTLLKALLLCISLLYSSLALSYDFKTAIKNLHKNNNEIKEIEMDMELNRIEVSKAYSNLLLPTIQATIHHGKTTEVHTANKGNGKSATKKKQEANIRQIEARQNIFAGGADLLNIKKANLQEVGIIMGKQRKYEEIVYKLVEAYIDLQFKEYSHNISVKRVKIMEKSLKNIKSIFKIGEVTKTSVAQIEANLESARASKKRAALDLINAKRKIVELTDLPVKFPISDINIKYPKQSEKKEIYLDNVSKNNLMYLQSINNHEISKIDLSISLSSMMPRVDAFAKIQKRKLSQEKEKTAIREGSYGFNINIPLINGGRDYKEANKMRHAVKKAKFSLQKTKEEVLTHAITSWNNYDVIDDIIGANKLSLDAARKAFKGTVIEVRVGTKTINDLIDTEQRQNDAKLKLKRSQFDKVLHFCRMSYFSGDLLKVLGVEGSL